MFSLFKIDDFVVHKPIVILIRDGWGYRSNPELNATVQDCPFTKELMIKYPHTLLQAAGKLWDFLQDIRAILKLGT